jgi:hypothetical protein
MIMAAPGRFSITTGLPQRSASAAAMTRAVVSIEPPADDAHGALGIALVGNGLSARPLQRGEERDRRCHQAAGHASEGVPLDHGLLPHRAHPRIAAPGAIS